MDLKEDLDNQNLIDKALKSEQPEATLEIVVQILSKKGLTRTEIYNLFLAYQVNRQYEAEWVQIENRYGDHPVMSILDRLNGWCNPTRTLLPEEPID